MDEAAEDLGRRLVSGFAAQEHFDVQLVRVDGNPSLLSVSAAGCRRRSPPLLTGARRRRRGARGRKA
uniref:Uncharacterized protein n=1 Tax=Oryza barthii TaxID=65489 RepID=A0A0D3FFN3_9ORYZ